MKEGGPRELPQDLKNLSPEEAARRFLEQMKKEGEEARKRSNAVSSLEGMAKKSLRPEQREQAKGAYERFKKER